MAAFMDSSMNTLPAGADTGHGAVLVLIWTCALICLLLTLLHMTIESRVADNKLVRSGD